MAEAKAVCGPFTRCFFCNGTGERVQVVDFRTKAVKIKPCVDCLQGSMHGEMEVTRWLDLASENIVIAVETMWTTDLSEEARAELKALMVSELDDAFTRGQRCDPVDV